MGESEALAAQQAGQQAPTGSTPGGAGRGTTGGAGSATATEELTEQRGKSHGGSSAQNGAGMNIIERKALVADLEKHGFRTVRCTADMDGDGVYNETFERANEDPSEVADRITIEWSKRGPDPLIEVLAGMDSQRCPYVSNDPLWTDSAYGKREDGLRCGLDAGHVNEHTLYSSDGERILPNAGWTLP